MGILPPPASGVTIRMYRQGLGDCFLLAFPTEQPGQAFYMLIDCGVIFGTQNPEKQMTDVATDIAAATGGDIHLLVLSSRGCGFTTSGLPGQKILLTSWRNSCEQNSTRTSRRCVWQ